MCNGHHRPLFRGSLPPYQTSVPENGAVSVVDNLRGRLEETELRLAQVRAREAELSRLLEEMKRLVSVMEILENYLKRQYSDRQEYVVRLLSPVSRK
ncbi:protein SKIP34 [Cucumis sativus]|uniref:Protein SKIP34 n=1 Tax=Cucumis sativus TaxID=3659 RepID=A0A0A0KIR5_CUCSA|nr:protein SKIP34 [Cucumis sativus]